MRSRVYASVGRPSVLPSVCPCAPSSRSTPLLLLLACGRGGQEISIDCCTACHPVIQQQMRVVPCTLSAFVVGGWSSESEPQSYRPTAVDAPKFHHQSVRRLQASVVRFTIASHYHSLGGATAVAFAIKPASTGAEMNNRERKCVDTIGTVLVHWGAGHFRC